MFTRVTRDQFAEREGVLIHMPTEAEFRPHAKREESVLVWTGNIGARLPSGEIFDYAEVLAMMRAVRREALLPKEGLELADA
jgi:hypothetical protein